MRYAKTFGLVYAVLALAIFVFCAPSHASAERVGENSDFPQHFERTATGSAQVSFARAKAAVPSPSRFGRQPSPRGLTVAWPFLIFAFLGVVGV